MPHLTFTLLVAALLSAALALLGNRTPRERVDAGIYFFLCCMTATFAGAWMMRLIHG